MNLLISAMLMLAVHEPGQGSVLITEEERRQFDRIGTCTQGAQSFDLRGAAFVEDHAIDVHSRYGPLRLSVRGENLRVESIGPHPRISPSYLDIDSRIDASRDLDIELELANFEGRLVLYWKETFQHRHYRQGLFEITDGELVPLCEGVGGRQVER